MRGSVRYYLYEKIIYPFHDEVKFIIIIGLIVRQRTSDRCLHHIKFKIGNTLLHSFRSIHSVRKWRRRSVMDRRKGNVYHCNDAISQKNNRITLRHHDDVYISVLHELTHEGVSPYCMSKVSWLVGRL